MSGEVRLVLPHQLFAEHLAAPTGTTFVLVEHDLLFRQYRFHTQKLVLHRAAMRRFTDRLREHGYDVVQVDTDEHTTSRAALAQEIRRLSPTRVTAYDVVDDWLSQDLTAALAEGGYGLAAGDVLESPGFLTTRAQIGEVLTGRTARMQHFYAWQRRRLDVLVTGDGEPVGGRWSFDEDNRKKLPRGHPVPDPQRVEDRHPEVEEAIAWVGRAFPDNPGDADAFAWPTSHDEAAASYEVFLAERLAEFGPYEDALAAAHPFVFHSLLTPALNVGLISPQHVLDRALEVSTGSTGGSTDGSGGSTDGGTVPLASLEGFLRQVIGWREFMRASYVVHGRRMRTRNHLAHTRPLDEGWWTAETGLEPVDLVLRRVLANGWAHHIERLMVLGNAMCLLRTDPDAAYEWFMEMFVDAYDWVMVPNVYAMSQFAAGELITTKPYVSASNYLTKMSDFPSGDWVDDWNALYWTFVRDHHDLFAGNARSRMIASRYDGLDPQTKASHTRRAAVWLA